MSKTTSYDKIPENLRKIKDEAAEKGSEIAEAVGHGYDNLKEKKDAAVRKIKDDAFSVNNSVHENPWLYIGGAACLGIVVGRLIRRC